MGCKNCKSKVEKLREKELKKLIKKGLSKDKAEALLPKVVTHNMKWGQLLMVCSFVFFIGWILVETFIFLFSYFYNLFF